MSSNNTSNKNSDMIIYTTEDGLTKIEATFDGDTVWLSKAQMAELFQRDRSVISKHIKNVFEEGELLREGNVQILHITTSDKPVEFYNLDVLLVDDIQFIAGKEKTHEVFFSIFNELVNNRKQICLTSDRMPQDIKGLEERIISRFNQGLNVNIEAPEYETSMNILKKKLMLNGGQNIDDEVLSYIATNFSKDVRQLEGALNRLLFFSITFAPVDHITIEIALEAFKDQIPEASNELSVVSIKKAVCDYYGITKQQLESKIRTKKIAIPRQIAMYLTRSLLDMPYKDIGNIFGKRDHSTVISACEKIEDLFKRDEMYQRSINEIKALIKG